MENLKQKNNLNNGFSLVEMLVAIGIFMSIMTLSVSSLISIIGANKKSQIIKSTIDSVTFALENISRDMRMGSNYECSTNNVDFAKICLDSNGGNIGGSAVRYIDNYGDGIIYYFLGGELIRKECTTNFTGCTTSYLVSIDSGAKITSMKFYVIGADKEFDPISTRTQPRAVITASGLISMKGIADTSYNLQTSISQRVRR